MDGTHPVSPWSPLPDAVIASHCHMVHKFTHYDSEAARVARIALVEAPNFINFPCPSGPNRFAVPNLTTKKKNDSYIHLFSIITTHSLFYFQEPPEKSADSFTASDSEDNLCTWVGCTDLSCVSALKGHHYHKIPIYVCDALDPKQQKLHNTGVSFLVHRNRIEATPPMPRRWRYKHKGLGRVKRYRQEPYQKN